MRAERALFPVEGKARSFSAGIQTRTPSAVEGFNTIEARAAADAMVPTDTAGQATPGGSSVSKRERRKWSFFGSSGSKRDSVRDEATPPPSPMRPSGSITSLPNLVTSPRHSGDSSPGELGEANFADTSADSVLGSFVSNFYSWSASFFANALLSENKPYAPPRTPGKGHRVADGSSSRLALRLQNIRSIQRNRTDAHRVTSARLPLRSADACTAAVWLCVVLRIASQVRA